MRAVVLRVDAPLVSFGDVLVDHHGVIDRFPLASQLTGLFGNALGWTHRDFDSLQTLQDNLVYAARWDVEPHLLIDYHTVDLTQSGLNYPGWTTHGVPEHRGGGPAARQRQRYQHYWADGLMTIVVSFLGDPALNLSIEAVEQALRYPARPLFWGRKTCLPARPILDLQSIQEGRDVLDVLSHVPRWDRRGFPNDSPEPMEATWPAELSAPGSYDTRQIFGLREWANQIPAGSYWHHRGMIQL